MKRNIIHCIVICLAALVLPVMVACSSQNEPLPDNVKEATLMLNVEQIGASRSGSLSDNEKMHSLRVIVLHGSDGTVEHNKFYPLDGPLEQKYILLKVSPNEKKRIFLFANEESVSTVEGVVGVNQTLTTFLNNYTEKMSGFESAVDNLFFAPDYSDNKPIPMSSMYEIDFPEKGNFDGTFYVVRVATKFIVNFINWRDEQVTVDNFTISGHADKNFLMAHVQDTPQNQKLFNGKSWIDWLKDVSDASSEDDDYETTEAAGWLKDYELPSSANTDLTYTHHQAVTVASPTVDIENTSVSKPGKTTAVFYLPESKNLKAGASDGEQQYTMSLNVDGLTEPVTYKLPNLKALFRNTLVVVNITMKNLEWKVEVFPYTQIVLNPDFGLDITPQ